MMQINETLYVVNFFDHFKLNGKTSKNIFVFGFLSKQDPYLQS